MCIFPWSKPFLAGGNWGPGQPPGQGLCLCPTLEPLFTQSLPSLCRLVPCPSPHTGPQVSRWCSTRVPLRVHEPSGFISLLLKTALPFPSGHRSALRAARPARTTFSSTQTLHLSYLLLAATSLVNLSPLLNLSPSPLEVSLQYFPGTQPTPSCVYLYLLLISPGGL